MAKKKGKVHRVVSDEKKQAIVLAAANAQRQLRRANLVFAGIILLALLYMGARVAMALLSDVQIAPDATPEPFSMPFVPAATEEAVAPSLDDAVDADDEQALGAIGLKLQRDEDLDRPGSGSGATARPQPTRDATAEEKQRFAALLAQGEKELNTTHNYPAAVKAFSEAARVSNIPVFDVERAERGLARARVYLDVTEGVVPVRNLNRFVRYQPPGGQPSLIGMVPKSESWRSGRVLITRMEDDTLLELNVERGWQATELDRAGIDAALADRLRSRLEWLQARKNDNTISPLDLCQAAVMIRQTGDVVQDGRTLSALSLAHACLGEAFDMCQAADCSLSQTLNLRRDPENQLMMGALTMIHAADRRLDGASQAERAVIESEMRKHLKTAQESLDHLLLRYPAAWDFRTSRPGEMLEEIRKQMQEEIQRSSEDTSGAGAPPVEQPPDLSDKPEWYLKKGEETAAQADTIVARTREADYNYDRAYEDLSRAVELYKQAREYLRSALRESPENKRMIEHKIVEVNSRLYAASKSRPVR